MKSPLTNLKESDLQKNTDLKPSKRSKQKLAELLSQVCALQKAYGKTPAELETLVEGFAWVLVDYDISQIMQAMRFYILNNSDIPAPADIRKIINETFDLRTTEQKDRDKAKNIAWHRKRKLTTMYVSKAEYEWLKQYEENNGTVQ